MEELASEFFLSEINYSVQLANATHVWLNPLRQSLYDRRPLLDRSEMAYFEKIERIYAFSSEFVSKDFFVTY